jgi:CHAT domain-containing protein
VVDLDLAGRVVVLSSCRSASGAVFEGQGVQSLARGFFVAGAHAVLGSLWPLRDEEAAGLFEDFYRHIGQGKSLAQALSQARQDRIRTGAPAAAWAGLVLLGDGELVPLPGGRRGGSPAWWQVGLAAVLLAAFMLAARALRRRRASPA